MKYVITIILFLTLRSCSLRIPSLSVTDKYLSVTKPGSSWALVEIEVLVIDSVFEYPTKEVFIQSVIGVNRKTNKAVTANGKATIFFSIKNRKYKWKIRDNLYSANVMFSEVFSIKPNTWYRLSSSNASYGTRLSSDRQRAPGRQSAL